ncbi:hypothetical protein [Mucilaginibacter sp. PAMB04168]|uniref:hypothetical protein n=1 Tax=Mucilaginibacter sp. PAMB04168 TaxID=3138567 RepID=UPI0031F70C87
MGQLLRITFENKDYTFKLRNALPADRIVNELAILLSGEEQVLIREGDTWQFKNSVDKDFNRLADAIGKAISLRFRI